MTLRVAVIGAGVVGVATAYELAAAGHEVTVFERRASVAGEGSFANSGVLAPALVETRLAHAALHVGLTARFSQAGWLWQRWRTRRPAADPGKTLAALRRLALASRRRLLHLTRQLQLDYEQTPGLLLLLRGERELKAARHQWPELEALDMGAALVDAERARQLEPSLHGATALAGALHLPQDGVGNARQFTHLLKAHAQKLGARFVFDTEVKAVRGGVEPELQLATGEAPSVDRIVVCAGAQARRLLLPLGLKLPLAAVHACSVTAPVRHLDGLPDQGPKAAIIDERNGITISRLGQRVRVSSRGHLGADRGAVPANARLKPLYRALEEWFPAAAITREAQHWQGIRPTLPDGLPVVGPAGPAGLWLNLGHGEHGWTLACASAQVVRAQIEGDTAAAALADELALGGGDLACLRLDRWP
jgi:D-amino-acid dehydrogenase